MSDIAGPYSSLKILHHPERIAQLRRGEQIVPIHCQLVISDLCSHSCFPAGTLIDCPAGQRPIELLSAGDEVLSPNGKSLVITELGTRVVDGLIEIVVEGKHLTATEDHPMLTQDGWKDARDLLVSDCLVVRLNESVRLDSLSIAGVEIEKSLALRPIQQLLRRTGTHSVYNFECPPVHAYIANGFVVSNCSFCSYRWDGNISNQLFHILDPNTGEKNHNPKRFISLEKCKEIMDDLAEMGVKACQITGGGSPTVHPDHHEIFKYGISKGLEMSLVTHGVLLKPDTIETLMGFSWIRVSVDAGKASTYASIRRIGEWQYHRAIDNIRLLCKRRDETKSKIVVGFGFVVTKENWAEVVDACLLARSIGVNSFRISAVFQPDNDAYFNEFFDEASALCKHCESLETDAFKVANSFGNRLSDLRQGHPDYKPCGYQQFTTYIGATLQSFRCCNTAYNERGLIGSIENQRFKELWESDAKKRDFDSFDARGCEKCQFNTINRALAYAVDGDAPHVNFV